MRSTPGAMPAWGRAVGEGVVHGGELGLHVVLAQADELEGLDHDLRIVVPHGAGGELHAVAHQIVLEGGDGQGSTSPAAAFFQNLQPAVGHGEGVVAELQSPDSSPISYMGKSTIQQNS